MTGSPTDNRQWPDPDSEQVEVLLLGTVHMRWSPLDHVLAPSSSEGIGHPPFHPSKCSRLTEPLAGRPRKGMWSLMAEREHAVTDCPPILQDKTAE